MIHSETNESKFTTNKNSKVKNIGSNKQEHWMQVDCNNVLCGALIFSFVSKFKVNPVEFLNAFRASIAWHSFTFPTIFDGFSRAMTDTCHTMCTVIVPYWFSIFKINISQRAEIYTFTTGNAGVCYIELFCMYKYRIK